MGAVENLQEIYVKLSIKFANCKTQTETLGAIEEILQDKNFCSFYKKRLANLAKLKQNAIFKTTVETIITSTDANVARAHLTDYETIKKLLEVLTHSFILYQMESKPDYITERRLSTKEDIINSLISKTKEINNVALYVWGSYIMRKEEFTRFSDLDLMFVVDSDRIHTIDDLRNNIIGLLEKYPHHNVPLDEELLWVTEDKGVARCGFIDSGVFINIKVVSKNTLFSLLSFSKKFVLEKNTPGMTIPDFKGNPRFIGHGSGLSAYPIVDDVLCRGFLVEFLHTAKLLVTSSNSLGVELEEIQRKCIIKSIKIIKYYRGASENLYEDLLHLSYTPANELNTDYAASLKRRFKGACAKYTSSAQHLLTYLHASLVLPQLTYLNLEVWQEQRFISFFLGAPYHVKNPKIWESYIKRHYDRIDDLIAELGVEEIIATANNLFEVCQDKPRLKVLVDTMINEIGFKETVLVLATTLELFEPVITKRAVFYFIEETLFEILFPKKFMEVATVLNRITNNIGGKDGVDEIGNILSKALVGKKSITKIVSRIRKPAGLLYHGLMKHQKLTDIDDVVSFDVLYTDANNFSDICDLIDEKLKTLFGNKITRKTLTLEEYSGCHFYFLLKGTTLEVMIRNLASNTSIEHKILHSVKQKRLNRLNGKL